MKKKMVTYAIFLLGILYLTPTTTLAFSPLQQACNSGSGSAVCQDSASSPGTDRIAGPGGIIATIITWVIRLVGAISIIMILFGGFRYITSGGDTNAVKGAKDTIIYAIVGLVVTGLASAILVFAVRGVGG